MNEPRNLLIVRTDRVGDVVLSLPLARAIKERFPSCRVSFLVRAYTQDLTRGHPWIDEVLVLEEGRGGTDVAANARAVRSRGFDTGIAVYPTLRIALVLLRSGIPRRIGTAYRWYSALFNERVRQHRRRGDRHELEHNMDLLRRLGIEPPDSPSFDLPVSPERSRKVETLLEREGVGPRRPRIVVHPGSGGSAVDLPLERFRTLVARMRADLDATILVTGLASEKPACDALSAGGGVVNLAGALELGDLVALIDRSDVLVANSTGPIHIAAALGKFVVGFYSKSPACSPARWGPYTDRRAVFMPTLGCSGCTRSRCRKLRCMESIDLDEALAAVKGALGGGLRTGSASGRAPS